MDEREVVLGEYRGAARPGASAARAHAIAVNVNIQEVDGGATKPLERSTRLVGRLFAYAAASLPFADDHRIGAGIGDDAPQAEAPLGPGSGSDRLSADGRRAVAMQRHLGF
ncbi:hypothetical protein CcI156_17680 [Frankia sp. CcI156]|uniref:hypothetical protein n=1 Tax=Frankia TaxID=1854 RepID=UPI0003D02DD3|nr:MULTISPECIES: hypothetical protein [Frankia]ETA01224.1 hypothetical protein CcI6DRAFT_03347 [Frankia sp. CcI6]KFB04669.1 hypothetical protein ALLO2DRAFT_02599 [Frankia sp. Allo2]OAA22591.1 hypothetical protein AAY23_106231 [Frankia casuarinae]OFB42227.1 hypothetical protein Manayef4_15360 [Frankia sp. CgIM4]ONH23749.1 hypothetical protein CcI156_17680 [Frankia sp. CcI156]